MLPSLSAYFAPQSFCPSRWHNLSIPHPSSTRCSTNGPTSAAAIFSAGSCAHSSVCSISTNRSTGGLRRQLRLNQDYLADASAAGASAPPDAVAARADYAQFLLHLAARRLGPTASLALSVSDGKSNLSRRILRLLDERFTPSDRASRLWKSVISVGALLSLFTIAAIHLTAQETPSGTAKIANNQRQSETLAPASPAVAKISLKLTGPETAQLGTDVRFAMEVSNIGKDIFTCLV